MQHNIMANFAILISFIFLISCAEQKSATQEIDVETASSSGSDTRSISTSTMRPRIVEPWSSVVKIGSSKIISPASDFFHGPFVNAFTTDDKFLSWRVHSNLDQVSGDYQSGMTTVIRKNALSSQRNVVPYGRESQSVSTLPKIVMDKMSGIAYAIWSDNERVFVSSYESRFGWRPSQNLGSGSDTWISRSENDQVFVVWKTELPNKSTQLAAAKYQPGLGWNALGSITRNASIVKGAEPVAINGNSIVFAWHEQGNTASSKPQIYTARISDGSGWQSAKLLTTVNSLGNNLAIELFLGSIPNFGRAELAYHVTGSLISDGIFTSAYTLNNNSDNWLSPQRLDVSVSGRPTVPAGEMKFATSFNGQMATAWIENRADNANMLSAVVISRYSAQNGWSAPQTIAEPLVRYPIVSPPIGSVPKFLHDIALSVDEFGEIYVAWVRTIDNLDQLKSVSGGLNIGWGIPQVVSSNNTPQDFISNLSLDHTHDGTLHLVWQQEKVNSPLQTSISVATSSKRGVPSPTNPVPIDPNQPAPLGHISSTNECFACHIQPGLVIIDHNQVFGLCIDCHNGSASGVGKPLNHIASTNNCEACHATTSWLPVLQIDHTQVSGTCISCHNGFSATGKGSAHLLSSNSCQTCHSTTAWLPAKGGVPTATLPPKTAAHMPTTDNCIACHVSNRVRSAIVNHNHVLGACYSCHNGIIATGKFFGHISSDNVCDQCHSTDAWLPAKVNNPGAGTSGGWVTPTNSLTFTSVSTEEFFHGPKIESLAQGGSMTTHILHDQFNPELGIFERSFPFVHINPDNFMPIDPVIFLFSWADVVSARMIKVKSGDMFGHKAGLLWKNGRDLLFRFLQSNNQLTASSKVGTVDGDYQLLSNGDGKFSVIWVEEQTPQIRKMHAKQYSPDSGWSGLFSTSISAAVKTATPILTSDNRVFVASSMEIIPSNGTNPASYQVVVHEFDDFVGWSNPINVSKISGGEVDLFMAQGSSGVMNVIATVSQINQATSSASSIHIASYSPFDGWSPFSMFGQPLGVGEALIGEPDVSFNSQGDVVIAWVKQSVDSANRIVTHVYTNYLSSSTNLWQGARRISSTPNVNELDPSVAVAEDGTAVIAWVSEDLFRENVMSNTYTPGFGWAAQGDVVANFSKPNDGIVRSPDISLNNTGQVLINWAQETKIDLLTEYKIWISKKSL